MLRERHSQLCYFRCLLIEVSAWLLLRQKGAISRPALVFYEETTGYPVL